MSNENEWYSTTYNMDQSHEQVEQKKPDQK